MRMVTDMRLLKAFANTAAELLGFIETALHLLRAAPSANAPATSNSGHSGHGGHAGAGSAGPATGSATGRLRALWQHSDVRGAVQATKEATQRGAFHDEELQHTWPGQEDPFLSSLLVQYATQVAGPQPPGPQSVAAQSGGGAAGAGQGTEKGAGQCTGVLWTEGTVGEVIGMLWVMHLRALCALRGLKPSEVLGARVLERLRSLQQQHMVAPGAGTQVGAFIFVATVVLMLRRL